MYGSYLGRDQSVPIGAAYLSDVAAFEVLVAGVTDNTRLSRKSAVWLVAGGVFLLAIPPMINMRIFVPWDLTFGSGMQTLGALIAVVTFGWFLPRHVAEREIGSGIPRIAAQALYYSLRFVVPGAILLVVGMICWTVVALLRGGKRSHSLDEDESKLMQELYHGLTKMEQRVESLETLLLDREKRGVER